MTAVFTRTAVLVSTVFLGLTACNNNGGQPLQTDNSSTNKSSHEDTLVTDQTAEVLIYKIGIPPHDSSDVFPEKVIRIKIANDKPTFLKFPAGGTETDISILDSSLVGNYIKVEDCPISKKLRFGVSETGLLDISDLYEGTYYIGYSSCNLGGSYRMYLTKQ